MIPQEIIAAATDRLKQAAPGSTIILFGSHARGEAREGSDLDILVVEPEVKARREEMTRLRDALRPLHIRADIVVVSKKTFDEWRDTYGTVIYAAAKEGKVLHAEPENK